MFYRKTKFFARTDEFHNVVYIRCGNSHNRRGDILRDIMLSLKATRKVQEFPKVHPEGRARAEEGAADPKESSIDKTLLHYITPARASPRSHNINACCISHLPSFCASSYFPIRARQNLPNIEKNISRPQTATYICARIYMQFQVPFSFISHE